MKILFIFSCLVFYSLGALSRPSLVGISDESEVVVRPEQSEAWKAFDGQIVRSITINGLIRTRLISIQWLMSVKKGEDFKSEAFSRDLQVLYNTGNLYDIQGDVTPDPQGGVDVTVSFKDKWTLFPAFGAQGGGGSSTVGGGIFESNLLGYLVNSSVLVWSFNGTTSYDINANQEYFAGTDMMWSLDWQDNIEAQTVHYANGNVAGQFAWRRQQKEIMLGVHAEGPWRFLFYTSVYADSVFNNDGGFNIKIPYMGLQQRFYPKAIFGRVNWTNYQENGFEFTLQPTVTNLIGPGPQWQALELDFKQVWKTGEKNKDNIAIYLSTSHMTQGGPNFIYEVGGYYNVRGYVDLREFGRDVAFANFEWRPYLFRHRYDFLDLDLMVVQGCIFSDIGSAWGDSSLTGESAASVQKILWSAGAGLRIHWVRFAGAILRLDWAQTLSPNEGVGFSFGIGQFF